MEFLAAFVFFGILVTVIGAGIVKNLPNKPASELKQPPPNFAKKARDDGFVYIYDGGMALHPDGIMRLRDRDGKDTDYPRSVLHSVRLIDGRVHIYTRLMEEPHITISRGAGGVDFFARLQAMIG